MSEIKLLPCPLPWCGAPAQPVTEAWHTPVRKYAGCSEIGCALYYGNPIRIDVEKWNARPSSEVREAVEAPINERFRYSVDTGFIRDMEQNQAALMMVEHPGYEELALTIVDFLNDRDRINAAPREMDGEVHEGLLRDAGRNDFYFSSGGEKPKHNYFSWIMPKFIGKRVRLTIETLDPAPVSEEPK